jgi:hypothetical protein
MPVQYTCQNCGNTFSRHPSQKGKLSACSPACYHALRRGADPARVAAYRRMWTEGTDAPCGYCWCGCGQKTATALRTIKAEGTVMGEPRRFVFGHNRTVRFLKGLDRAYTDTHTGYDSACWLYEGHIDRNGYGKLTGGWAHRAYYEWFVGPIPDGHHVHHLCGVPRCVNPEHLVVVLPTRHGRTHRKLTQRQMQEIRAEVAMLSKRYGVKPSSIAAVITGRMRPRD